jgi:fumarate reductase subunit D
MLDPNSPRLQVAQEGSKGVRTAIPGTRWVQIAATLLAIATIAAPTNIGVEGTQLIMFWIFGIIVMPGSIYETRQITLFGDQGFNVPVLAVIILVIGCLMSLGAIKADGNNLPTAALRWATGAVILASIVLYAWFAATFWNGNILAVAPVPVGIATGTCSGLLSLANALHLPRHP